MSLFATDSSLTDAPFRVSSVRPPDNPGDVIAQLLPQLVAGFMASAHVRSAATAYELASAVLPTDSPQMVAMRQQIDSVSAVDARLHTRLISGEIVLVPSLTEASPGVPEFYFGANLQEITHPGVYSFLQQELSSGAQAELRNFLQVALADDGCYIDLEPEAGAGVLSALSLSSGHVIALPSDPTIRAVIDRNAKYVRVLEELPGQQSMTFISSVEEARAFVNDKHTIINIGNLPISALAMHTNSWRNLPIAVAWKTNDDSMAHVVQNELEQLGFSSFVLTSDDDGLALYPFQGGRGATVAFSLTEKFIETRGVA